MKPLLFITVFFVFYALADSFEALPPELENICSAIKHSTVVLNDDEIVSLALVGGKDNLAYLKQLTSLIHGQFKTSENAVNLLKALKPNNAYYIEWLTGRILKNSISLNYRRTYVEILGKLPMHPAELQRLVNLAFSVPASELQLELRQLLLDHVLRLETKHRDTHRLLLAIASKYGNHPIDVSDILTGVPMDASLVRTAFKSIPLQDLQPKDLKDLAKVTVLFLKNYPSGVGECFNKNTFPDETLRAEFVTAISDYLASVREHSTIRGKLGKIDEEFAAAKKHQDDDFLAFMARCKFR